MVEEGKIYLLLSDTGTVLTKLIKTYTKMPYNHASIAFDSKLREVYSFGINANLRVYSFDCLMMYSFDELMHNILEVKEYYAYSN